MNNEDARPGSGGGARRTDAPPASIGTTLAAGGELEALAAGRERTRQHYLLAAVLFLGGGVGAIVPDALHDPPHPAAVFLLPLLAVVSGAITWFLAGRLPRRHLHLVSVVAALEVALTVALADRVFSIYFIFIAIFAAYVFVSRTAIAAHIAFVSLLSFAPLLYSSEPARQSLLEGSVLLPTLVLAGGAVAYLRERLAASETRYRLLSELDPLTGVGNYRMLSLRVPRELVRHRRAGLPLSLFVIDLDDFKRINDSYGHQRGDVVLCEVAAALLRGVRDGDVVARQGGDEFAVVAPGAGAAEAAELAERLQVVVREVAPDGAAMSASIGCARCPDDAESLEGLLAAADARLRDAKADKPVPPYRPPAARQVEASTAEVRDAG